MPEKGGGGKSSHPSSCRRRNSRSTAALCKRPLKLCPAPGPAARGLAAGLSGCTVRRPSMCIRTGSMMTQVIARRMCGSPRLGRRSRSSRAPRPPCRRRPGQSSRAGGRGTKTSCETMTDRPSEAGPRTNRYNRPGTCPERVECQLVWIHVRDHGDSEDVPQEWQMHFI